MPIYEFRCNDCGTKFDELCSMCFEGIYAGVFCPKCESSDKERLISAVCATFADPRGTSKADSFSYVAGYNMEQAKEERRRAEAKSHMGTQPFNEIDDVSCGKYEGPVQ
mgnify:CR=1 FL=1